MGDFCIRYKMVFAIQDGGQKFKWWILEKIDNEFTIPNFTHFALT
jgi:hypothetical protein